MHEFIVDHIHQVTKSYTQTLNWEYLALKLEILGLKSQTPSTSGIDSKKHSHKQKAEKVNNTWQQSCCISGIMFGFITLNFVHSPLWYNNLSTPTGFKWARLCCIKDDNLILCVYLRPVEGKMRWEERVSSTSPCCWIQCSAEYHAAYYGSPKRSYLNHQIRHFELNHHIKNKLYVILFNFIIVPFPFIKAILKCPFFKQSYFRTNFCFIPFCCLWQHQSADYMSSLFKDAHKLLWNI